MSDVDYGIWLSMFSHRNYCSKLFALSNQTLLYCSQVHYYVVVFSTIKAVGKLMCPGDVDIGMYRGTVNVSNGGKACQNWSSITPHRHSFKD